MEQEEEREGVRGISRSVSSLRIVSWAVGRGESEGELTIGNRFQRFAYDLMRRVGRLR